MGYDAKVSPTTNAAIDLLSLIEKRRPAPDELLPLARIVRALAGDVDVQHQEINALKRRVLALEGSTDAP